MDGQRDKGKAAALGLSVNPVRDSATEVQRAVSEDLVAAWRTHVARIEQELHNGWQEQIRTIVADRFTELSGRLSKESDRLIAQRLEDLRRTEVDTAVRNLTETLNISVRRLQTATSRGPWLSMLVDAATAFAQRVAILTLRETDGPLSLASLDLQLDSGKALPSEPVPLCYAPALLSAVESGQSVIAMRSGAEISVALENMLGPGGSRAHIYPILVQGRTFAVLYAEGATDGNALELLATAAGMSAASNRDILKQESYERPASRQATPRPNGWNELRPEDQEVHLRAQRFARTQAAQLRLYKPQEVREGRATSDLYGMLQPHIDQARQAYHDQFVVGCESMVDYLHFELIKTLANNDERLLGGAYPGPLQ
jgi:hypothetical protein